MICKVKNKTVLIDDEDMDIANELGVSYSAVHRVIIGQSFNGGRISRRGKAKKNDIQ